MMVGTVLGRLLGMSGREFEYDHALILQQARERGPEIAMKFDVVFEPPKAVPRENQKTRASLAQPFQFADCCRVVLWWSPVAALAFQERNDRPVRQRDLWTPLFVIHEDE